MVELQLLDEQTHDRGHQRTRTVPGDKLRGVWVSLGTGVCWCWYSRGGRGQFAGEIMDSALHVWNVGSPWVEMSRRYLGPGELTWTGKRSWLC